MTDECETLRIGIWQDQGTDQITKNLETISKAAQDANAQNVDILVFPECFLTGYYQDKNIEKIAKSIDDSVIEILEQLARDYNVALVIGTYELSDNDLFNAAIFISPTDGHIASYHKQALYGKWEQTTFTRGDNAIVLDYCGWKIGLLICFDVEFPELVRKTAHLGADIIIVPTSLMAPYDAVAKHIIPTRALENQIYVVYANRIGDEQEFSYIGQSSIYGPYGYARVVADGDETQFLVANIDKADLIKARKDFSYLAEAQKNNNVR